MRAVVALPWHYWIFTAIVCQGVCVLSAMYQQDEKDNFRDRPLVIAAGAVASLLAFATGITGVVKFVIWWRG